MERSFAEEYWKHTALNLGQAVRDIRFFYYHPDADLLAPEGTPKHFIHSVFRRMKGLGNNVFYSVIPPHWHHTAEDLISMSPGTAREWFLHGYAPWDFPDPSKSLASENRA